MTQPVFGTTDFENIPAFGGQLATGTPSSTSLVASNVDGWDFTLLSAIPQSLYITPNSFTIFPAFTNTTTIRGGSQNNLTLTQFGVKADNGTVFNLNSVDIAVFGRVGSTSTVELIGMSNGQPVAGATLTMTIINNRLVTFDVSSNAAFQGITEFDVTDGGSTSSQIFEFDVDNINVNFPGPAVTVSSGSAAFVSGDNSTSIPVAIDPNLTLTDPASATLASATVSLTGNFQSSEDVLGFTNDPATMGNIAGTYGNGILMLTSSNGTATVAQWQAALRSVTYTDIQVTPNNATRTVSISANDGSTTSTIVTRTITVTATAQSPVTSPIINQPPITPATTQIFRFFDPSTGSHFFTSSVAEKDAISNPNSPGYQPNFVPETNGFTAIDPAANDPNATVVYRFFDKITGAHFMTASAGERDAIMNPASSDYQANYVYEPSATIYEHSTRQSGDVVVYRLFNAIDGTHFYTSNAAEFAGITTAGSASYRPNMVSEGIAFYAPNGSAT